MKKRRAKPEHHATDFGLAPTDSDYDMFRWFLLSFLFGKPIQSTVAVNTWQLFIDKGLDTPWAILNTSEPKLVKLLRAGGYTRYQHVTARALHTCMDQLVRGYDGSVLYMVSIAETEDELSRMVQKFYGVGPKTAEIFMRETTELFARRVE